jgi:hypothetical protein
VIRVSGYAQDPIDSGELDWVFDGELEERFNYTRSDLTIVARVLSRACPTCEASVGNWCLNRHGHEIQNMDWQHVERRLLRSGGEGSGPPLR